MVLTQEAMAFPPFTCGISAAQADGVTSPPKWNPITRWLASMKASQESLDAWLKDHLDEEMVSTPQCEEKERGGCVARADWWGLDACESRPQARSLS